MRSGGDNRRLKKHGLHWGGVVVIAALLLAGCKVDARVDVSLRDNGSGTLRTTLTIDAEAVARIGGRSSLARTVPLDDLRTAGWSITPFAMDANGSAVITFAHPFADEADLARRLEDLVGAHGVVRSAQISHNRGWLASRDGFSLVVDMRAPSPGITRDAALVARLRAAGVDPVALQAQFAKELRTALHLSVTVHLPNGHTEKYDAVNGSVATWRVTDGATDWDRVVRLGIAAALVLLAMTFVLAATMSARRERRRRRERIVPEPERVPLM